MVEVNDRSIKVTSPLKAKKFVSIIVENKTFDRIVSEIKTDKKVLKRFVLEAAPKGKQVIQVKWKDIKKLYYVPIAPPFEAAELKLAKNPYEIPKKK